MKKLFLIFFLLPIFLNAQIKRAFLFEQSGQNIIPTTMSNILPFGNQLGDIGSNSIRWNFIYGDAIVTNSITTSGLLLAQTVQSTNYTATSSDYSIFCIGGTSGITIALPAAASNIGRVYIIKKIDSGAGKITIDANLNETIDGSLTWLLTLQYESITIQSNGSNWYIL